MISKPLLSGKAPEMDKIQFPVKASVKLDGIRCLTLPPDGAYPGQLCRAVSRTLKPIQNVYIRELLERNLPPGFDGELMLSDWTAPYNDLQSAIMSRKGTPDFHYCVFDFVEDDDWLEAPFHERYQAVETEVGRLSQVHGLKWLWRLRQTDVYDADTLQNFLEMSVDSGYEGVMIRDPEGIYKQGRSTVRDRILLKIKLWDDEEATIVAVEEQMHNENQADTDELGHTKRSSAQEGLVPAGTLGSLCCMFEDETIFNVGTGFDAETRARLWARRDRLPGKTVKIKYQPDPGGRQPGQAPRFPVFLGFRED